MRKVGYTIINKERLGGKPAKCANCGGKGVYRVTFQDLWGKLIVTLCESCARKQYEDLQLQTTLNWPAKA